jgi:hypothetical protein
MRGLDQIEVDQSQFGDPIRQPGPNAAGDFSGR